MGDPYALSYATNGAPAAEPLTTAEAKRHLRLAADFTDDDTDIASYVKAAREWVEECGDVALINQTLELRLDAFPGQGQDLRAQAHWDRSRDRYAIFVPRAPLASVTSIVYLDTDGASQTLSASLYQVDTKTMPGRIAPAFAQAWPSVREQMAPVVVTYVAGYGAASTAVPESFRSLIRLLVAHQYENREPLVIGTIVAELPHAIQTLFRQVRTPMRMAA